jgi:hypothetical protein
MTKPQFADGGVDQQSITTFVDDSPKDVAVLESIVESIPKTARDETYSSLYAYLTRPIQVASGTWSDSDSALTFNHTEHVDAILEQLTFPDVLLEKSSGFICKLKDFALLRASVDIRVQINATPMQSGKLWAMFAPYQNEVLGRWKDTTYNLSGITGYDGIEIDLASANSVVFSLPYSSFRESYNLVTGEGIFGEFFLWALSPLRLGSVDYTITASFRELHLSVPSPLSTVLLSTRQFTSFLEKMIKERDLLVGDANDVLLNIAYTPELPTILEEMPQAQVLEKVLGGVTNIIGKATSVVNTVTQVASSVIPLASSLASAAAMFGFSKPSNESATSLCTSKPARSLHQTSGSEDVVRLTGDPMCSLGGTQDIYTTNQDEMSIAYICGRPNIVDTFLMTVDDTEGSSLIDIPITPSYAKAYAGTAKAGHIACTQIAYVSNLFAYWTGTLNYVVKFSKTPFHSARIRISYWPFTNAYDSDTVSNAYSIIMELRESSEISFSVPYVSTLPWLQTNSYAQDVGCTGRLRISVVNALKNAGDSDSTIDGFIWVSAGEDFKLSGYGLRANKVIAEPFVLTEDPEDPDPPTLLPQAQIGETNISPTNVAQNSASMSMLQTVTDPAYTIYSSVGEHFCSLRQLLKRAAFWRTIGTPHVNFTIPHPLDENADMLSSTSSISNTWNGFYSQVGGTSKNNLPHISYISRLFRYYRGSLRYHFFFSGGHKGYLKLFPMIEPTFNPPMSILPIGSSSVAQVEVPFAQQCNKRVVGYNMDGKTSKYVTLHGVTHGYSGQMEVFLNVGEDFSFGCLVGAPSVTTYTAGVPNIDGNTEPELVTITDETGNFTADVNNGALLVSS